jgi:small subunit ribosomal protein S6
MYIVSPELDEPAVQQEIDRVGQLIETNGGQVRKVTPWGKRRLAYTIGEHQEGHYVVAEFDLEPTRVTELERLLKISDNVFRHLVVREEDAKR